MISDAARKACVALDCSDRNDPDRKQDLATSLKVPNLMLHAHASAQLIFQFEFRQPLTETTKEHGMLWSGVTLVPVLLTSCHELSFLLLRSRGLLCIYCFSNKQRVPNQGILRKPLLILQCNCTDPRRWSLPPLSRVLPLASHLTRQGNTKALHDRAFNSCWM